MLKPAKSQVKTGMSESPKTPRVSLFGVWQDPILSPSLFSNPNPNQRISLPMLKTPVSCTLPGYPGKSSLLTHVLPDLALDPSHLTNVEKKTSLVSKQQAFTVAGLPSLADSEGVSLSFKKRGPPIITAVHLLRACWPVPESMLMRSPWSSPGRSGPRRVAQPARGQGRGTSTWATAGTPSQPPGPDADAQQGKGEDHSPSTYLALGAFSLCSYIL